MIPRYRNLPRMKNHPSGVLKTILHEEAQG
jgi:hypothetical protein